MPTENGVNGAEDSDMTGNDPEKGKGRKDADDEMTVVVPPPHTSKLSADPDGDGEGDVSMEDSQGNEEEGQQVVDPKVQTIAGIAPSC